MMNKEMSTEMVELIRIVSKKTKAKNLWEVCVNVTNYYFTNFVDYKTMNEELLDKMTTLFALDTIDYLLHSKKKKINTKKIIENIDKELLGWKKKEYNRLCGLIRKDKILNEVRQSLRLEV